MLTQNKNRQCQILFILVPVQAALLQVGEDVHEIQCILLMSFQCCGNRNISVLLQQISIIYCSVRDNPTLMRLLSTEMSVGFHSNLAAF